MNTLDSFSSFGTLLSDDINYDGIWSNVPYNLRASNLIQDTNAFSGNYMNQMFILL